jgi:hypothetical protein
VEELLSFCQAAREPGKEIDQTHATEGKTAAQEIPEADPGDDGWTDRSTLDGKGTAQLSFAMI